MTTLTKTAIRHVILDGPLRCFAQMMTAYHLAEAHGATLHLTGRCAGSPRKKHPGMSSSCGTDGDTCRCDLGALRAEGATDITRGTPCWSPDGTPCRTCSTGVAARPAEREAPRITARTRQPRAQVAPAVQAPLW